jgi:cysteine synthase A
MSYGGVMMVSPGLSGAIGNTPHIALPKLSAALGRTIVGKAEFLNPGGSVKDRAAKGIVDDAEQRGALAPGGTIVEGTAGNTGIALALIGNERGYRVIICIPDDQSSEKYDLLRTYGADLRIVEAVPFTNDNNYYHVARRTAADIPGALWADQFNNIANRRAHYETTGPEIWSALGSQVTAFVAACGTGGTLAGTSAFLKERNPAIRVVLCGSAALNVAGAARVARTLPEGSTVVTILCDGGERYRSRLWNPAFDAPSAVVL